MDLRLDAEFRNVLLIRDPVEVVASYVRARETCEPDDIGLPQQGVAAGAVGRARLDVPILDARDFLARARSAPALAVRLAGNPVHRPDAVLARRVRAASDGVWAPHWYAAVWASTGFAPPAPAGRRTCPTTTPRSRRHAGPIYAELHARRVVTP